MLFDQLKQWFRVATTDADFVAKNTLAQNSTLAQDIASHINALTPDINFKLRSEEVTYSSGLISNDSRNRSIKFDTIGSKKMVLGYLENNLTNPQKIWVRTTVTGETPSDGRRYWVADPTSGVVFFSESGEIIGVVPGFDNIAGDGYEGSNSVITFFVGDTEYVAICCQTQHVVRIYELAGFSLVATIGTPGVQGLPGADELSSPSDLAFDPASSVLYISCQAFAAPGAIGDGFIASFDFAIPATPTFVGYVAINNGGKLLHAQVDDPVSIFWDPDRSALWTVSGSISTLWELGAISVSTTPGVSDGYLNGYIELSGLRRPGDSGSSTYTVVQPGRIHLRPSDRMLFVGDVDKVDVFDSENLVHYRTYGEYALEEKSGTTARRFALAFSGVTAVAADVISTPTVDLDLFLVADGNRRVVRISEIVYADGNLVGFTPITTAVPTRICGYLIRGTVDTSQVELEYRLDNTSSNWRILDTCSNPIDPSTYFEFRLRVFLSPLDIIQEKVIESIIVVGEQS